MGFLRPVFLLKFVQPAAEKKEGRENRFRSP
jgi:hypothetical protein